MDEVRRYFANDHFAKMCGIELTRVEPGLAEARMVLDSRHLNGYGTVQGGAIFTLADFAFAAASNSHGTVAVGISTSMQFIKAAKTGALVAQARELSRNFKLGAYGVEVRDDAGDLVAAFQGMVYRKQESVSESLSGS
jgi:acyl-CoA thioesterase